MRDEGHSSQKHFDKLSATHLPNDKLPTTNYPLPTTHYPLPTTHYQPPTTNYQLFIIGPDEGGEQARLEKIIQKYNLEDKVTFVGQLDGKEKNQFISSCDLFLFLSRGEGLPMTILEVAALGVPSLLSKECYIPEIAAEDGGYEVNKEEFDKNAKLILKHFQDENKKKQMKKNIQKVVQEKFGLDIIVEKILELYNS